MKDKAIGAVTRPRTRTRLSTRLPLALSLGLLALVSAAIAYAQVGGSFDLSWNTVDGGGGRSTTGGYELSGDIGQADSTIVTSTNVYTLYGGFFWAGPVATPCPACPSRTPTPLPTACAIQFTDVPPNNTFYAYIRCLACKGIIGGYTDPARCPSGVPCFRPADNVTRAQLAKIVSNAAGFNEQWSEQTFTDVPPASPFYQYIERLYNRSIINGYTDPAKCPTGVPCFLPGAPVTRGQLSKIDANGAGLQDDVPPGRQTFTDVPPSSPFWLYIERLYALGYIGGYNNPARCPGGVPCFLPGNPTTRGQTAKIVGNTFFPNCVTPARR